jgi:hypothetical protein
MCQHSSICASNICVFKQQVVTLSLYTKQGAISHHTRVARTYVGLTGACGFKMAHSC